MHWGNKIDPARPTFFAFRRDYFDPETACFDLLRE
jgi:hypothetical protein